MSWEGAGRASEPLHPGWTLHQNTEQLPAREAVLSKTLVSGAFFSEQDPKLQGPIFMLQSPNGIFQRDQNQEAPTLQLSSGLVACPSAPRL